MPSLTATATTTQEIKLKPSVRSKLLRELRTYQELGCQIKALKHAMDQHKAVIGEIRDETGEQSLSLEGFTITLVAPIKKKFNPSKFVTNGGDLALYNMSFDEVPTRSYEKITVPGDTADEAE